MRKEKSAARPFQRHEVEDYERKRFRGPDQRLVHWREERILRRVIGAILKEAGRGRPLPVLPVLDIPCGYGRFSPLLEQEGVFLVSSDLSFHMARRAGEKASGRRVGAARPAGAAAVVADAVQGLPFKREVFALLLSMRFFHHLHQREERQAVLQEFSRVTAGWVVVSFYRRNWLHVLQRKARRAVRRSRTRIRMISGRDFAEEVRGAGFRIVKIFPLLRGIHSQHIALLRKG